MNDSRRAVTQGRFAAETKKSQFWESVSAMVVAVVVAFAVLDVNFGLRVGALICGLWALRAMNTLRLPDGLALAYAGFAALSLFWSVVPELSRNSTMNVAACVAVFLAVRVSVTSVRSFLIIGSGFLAGACATVVRLSREANATLRWTYEEDAVRLGIDGLNVNYSAYALVTTASVVVAMIRMRSVTGRGLPHLVLLAMLPVLYLGVLLNGTRGALISLALLLAWWLLARRSTHRALIVLVVCTLLVNFLILVGWTDSFITERVIASGRETGDLNGRLTMWPLARDALVSAPFIGHGVGTLPGLAGNPLGINAHSAILDVGTGLGAVGILLFGATIWISLARGARDYSNPSGPFVVGAFLITSLPVLLSGFWVESPVLWSALALFSRVTVFSTKDPLGAVPPDVASPDSELQENGAYPRRRR